MEAAALGLFMISAGLFGTLLEHPDSPVRQAIECDGLRRALMGLAMGVTAIVIIYSPWGRRSGAHMNPAVTLTFLRLGKVKAWDAAFYMVSQFLGGLAGVGIVAALLGGRFTAPPVSFVATTPGPRGTLVAFAAEVMIAAVMMGMILITMNSPRWSRRTGLLAGLLVALFITFEAPYSGMSLNPARTTASALPSGLWTAWWVYFLAPPLGMLLAVEMGRWLRGRVEPHCAKLNHHTRQRCIFCGFGMTASCDPSAPRLVVPLALSEDASGPASIASGTWAGTQAA